MAAHPGLSISSSFLRDTSGLTSTPQAFRHRYHTRRKRSATSTSGMAAPHSSSLKVSMRDAGDAGFTENGRGDTSVTTPLSSDSGSHQSEHPPEESGASDMRIDVDAAVVPLSGGGSGVDRSLCRWRRVLSCPAVEHHRAASASEDASAVRPAAATAAAPGLGGTFVVTGSADNVSSARGITIGDVHGSVRAKTAPVEAAPAPESTEAAAAAAATAATAIAEHYSDIAAAEVVSMSLGGGEDSPKVGVDAGGERTFRATSSGASFVCKTVPEASNKRAKSGAIGPVVAASLGGQGAWIAPGEQPQRPHPAPEEEAHPTPAEALSSMTIDPAAAGTAAGTAATTPPPPPPPADNDRDAAAAVAAAKGGPATAAVMEPPEAPTAVALTNEAWLARLSPLLESIPAGTHPEDYLHDILRERGYTTEMVAMKETVFHRPPEADQVAAYDKAILRAVVDEDEAALERMRAAGRRMDACNRFGDSVLHMACRRGRAKALRFLLRATGPAGVVLSDDFGRTVMHDACWTAAPRFDVASAVLDSDTRLLRTLDSRGSSPLQYVPQDQWSFWCAFFESRKEVYWPQLPPGAEDLAGIIPLTD